MASVVYSNTSYGEERQAEEGAYEPVIATTCNSNQYVYPLIDLLLLVLAKTNKMEMLDIDTQETNFD